MSLFSVDQCQVSISSTLLCSDGLYRKTMDVLVFSTISCLGLLASGEYQIPSLLCQRRIMPPPELWTGQCPTMTTKRALANFDHVSFYILITIQTLLGFRTIHAGNSLRLASWFEAWPQVLNRSYAFLAWFLLLHKLVALLPSPSFTSGFLDAIWSLLHCSLSPSVDPISSGRNSRGRQHNHDESDLFLSFQRGNEQDVEDFCSSGRLVTLQMPFLSQRSSCRLLYRLLLTW